MSPPSFFPAIARVVAITATTPTEVSVNEFVEMCRDSDVYRTAFNILHNPSWLRPLQDRGFFSNPPAAKRDAHNNRVATYWPPSGYLARVAATAPEAVTSILTSFSTDNWLILRDTLEALRAVPIDCAATAVPSLIANAASLSWYQMIDVGEFADALAKHGHAIEAFDLINAVLGGEVVRQTTSRHRQDDYGFFKSIDACLESLVASRPSETVSMLRDWLAIHLEQHTSTEAPNDDQSWVWRPAIEEHDQNHDFEFVAQLVSPTRSAVESSIRAGFLPLGELLRLFSLRPFVLFTRIRLHLLAEFGDKDVALTRAAIMDRELFEDYRVKHEYSRLVAQQFTLLTPDEQAEWRHWLEQWALEQSKPRLIAESNPTLQEKRRRYNRFERLHWIRLYLTPEEAAFYEQMLEDNGAPVLSDFTSYFRIGSGLNSPYSADDFARMGFEEALKTLETWNPSTGNRTFEDPSLEGLAAEFGRYLKAEAVACSKFAGLMKGKRPAFVRGFIEAMSAAVKGTGLIDAAQVLDLCEWVNQQPLDQPAFPPSESTRLFETDWQWCRDAISQLIEALCDAKDDDKLPKYGIELRERLFGLLGPLFDAPAKSYIGATDKPIDVRTVNWIDHCLNSPRGKAMRALIEYTDWVVDHIQPDRLVHKKGLPGGFGRLDEVRKLFESQIEREDDSFAGRAGFGYRFGLLWWLDSNWLRKWAPKIFDLEAVERNSSRAFGWAAWNTFLFASHPHFEFFKILGKEYSYAVDQSKSVDLSDERRRTPFSNLAQHLILLYARGHFGDSATEGIEAKQRLMHRLIIDSPLPVRTHAMEYVSRTIGDDPTDLPEPVKARYVGLWEYYWEQVGEGDAKSDPESSVFGRWFASAAFDEQWSIEQLERFVNAAPRANPDHMIMERLAQIADTDILRSVRIVDMLVDGDIENWRVGSWDDEAYTILGKAMQRPSKAKEIAERVIDKLGRRGYLKFGALLDPPLIIENSSASKA